MAAAGRGVAENASGRDVAHIEAVARVGRTRPIPPGFPADPGLPFKSTCHSEVGINISNPVGVRMLCIPQLGGRRGKHIVADAVGAAVLPLPVRHGGGLHRQLKAFRKSPVEAFTRMKAGGIQPGTQTASGYARAALAPVVIAP